MTWEPGILFYPVWADGSTGKRDLQWVGDSAGPGPQFFSLQGLFAVSCQLTAQLVICQEKKEQPHGL